MYILYIQCVLFLKYSISRTIIELCNYVSISLMKERRDYRMKSSTVKIACNTLVAIFSDEYNYYNYNTKGLWRIYTFRNKE